MTATTSVVVALAMTIAAYMHLRAGVAERSAALRQGLEDIALASRYHVEASEPRAALANAKERGRDMSKAVSPYLVELGRPQEAIGMTSRASRRVAAITEGNQDFLFAEEGGLFIYTLPIRTNTITRVEGFEAIGSIEVSVSTQGLEDAYREDLRTTVPMSIGIILTVLIALLILTRFLVTTPIAKLLTGVDDVAHGDLSRVLMAEREDEIGDLAARFNEMTFSLRESKSQTKRHAESRMDLEQKLFQTEKLATIGQIAAEIAHEVGTPLNVISGRAKGMIRKSSNPEAIEKNATIIAEQTARITRIIQRLLDFSRSKVGVEEKVAVDLKKTIEDTFEFLESKLAAGNVTHENIQADKLPPVHGNPDQILQILTNLLLNAAEAMSESGGNIRVESFEVTRRRPGLGIAPEAAMVVVSVSDSGPGIPEEERERIFEPFYSSKTRKGGTGLGLAVVHGIVNDHDGWIEVSDAASGGACFSVYLPASKE
ncbi:MAG: HAMP domain-containing protein [Kofleriaceae bacterium]|nr:HAMP domain-containing protein [Kofleriaceae bacterium]